MISLDAIAEHLKGSRFYAAKSAPIEGLEVLDQTPVALPDASIQAVIAQVQRPSATEAYQLFVDDAGRDVLATEATATALGELFAAHRPPLGRARGDLRPLAGLAGRALGQEQSNTTLVFGPDGEPPQVAVKFFRRLSAGMNPEIELLDAISECECVPRLFGWVEADYRGEPVALATAQEFFAGSRDGWLDAQDVAATGADFSERAFALGRATRQVHDALAQACGVSQSSGEALRARLAARLDDAASAVAALGAAAGSVVERARARYRELVGDCTVQRIHGDLHLGQVLHTDSGYRLIDFEGEPARPLAERRQPDPAVRDVAGLVRSIDYAAHFPSYSGSAPGPEDPRAWADRATAALLRGYGLADAERGLLDAYVLDKALYEVAYEENNRPDWAGIPRAAVARLLGDEH